MLALDDEAVDVEVLSGDELRRSEAEARLDDVVGRTEPAHPVLARAASSAASSRSLMPSVVGHPVDAHPWADGVARRTAFFGSDAPDGGLDALSEPRTGRHAPGSGGSQRW